MGERIRRNIVRDRACHMNEMEPADRCRVAPLEINSTFK
jgi:hypothetical protein